MNAVNGVHFQDEQLSILVDEYVQLGEIVRRAPSSEGRDLSIRVANLKCEIGDRLNKRHQKEKEKFEYLEILRKLISNIKIRKLSKSENSAELKISTIGGDQTPPDETMRKRKKYSLDYIRQIISD
jgi:hypothetical protein